MLNLFDIVETNYEGNIINAMIVSINYNKGKCTLNLELENGTRFTEGYEKCKVVKEFSHGEYVIPNTSKRICYGLEINKDRKEIFR